MATGLARLMLDASGAIYFSARTFWIGDTSALAVPAGARRGIPRTWMVGYRSGS